jgi:hypothetical protein
MTADLERAAWAARADDLAAWAWERYVNRVDVWGGYNALADRGTRYTDAEGRQVELGATLTRPGKAKRGKVFLTPAVLRRHFRAAGPEDVVGLHTTGPDNASRFGTVEIDWHGRGAASPEANLAAALSLHGELTRRGFRPLLWDSNGRGGYHLDLLLSEPAPTGRLFAFLKALAAGHARHGLLTPPEVFPKQRQIGAGKYGNWVRLPGRHHTRDCWARVWDGGRWLAGGEAAAFLPTFGGDLPGLLPPEPPGPPPRPAAFTPLTRGNYDLTHRVRAYLARLPNLSEGQGRDDVAFQFASFLVRDLQLSDAAALSRLEAWDGGNRPPKGKARLAEIVKNAHADGKNGYGSGLGAPAAGGHGLIRFGVGV